MAYLSKLPAQLDVKKPSRLIVKPTRGGAYRIH